MKAFFRLYNCSPGSYHATMESINRRSILFSTSVPATAALFGTIRQGQSKSVDPIGTFKPILQRDQLPDPVIIESLALHNRGGNWFIRARSKDGAEGWSVGHPGKMELSQQVFTKVIGPYMRGKDARDLDQFCLLYTSPSQRD